ncbi:MAG: hypothetical protein JW963_05060 [Anaerolineales bacterium]|nr:hypothetical protein [Anaerolineales bacterium]
MKERVVRLSVGLLFLFLVAPMLLSAHAQGGDSELPQETVDLIHEVRVATTQYHDLDTALDAGYGKFLDCFTHGEDRGMGQHYVHGDLVGDDILDAMQPEALVYEPLGDGRQVLVAYEYLVFADVWDPNEEGREPPSLFGQDFVLKTTIPDTPPVWALHIWLWSHNPEGLFADYNPIIVCPADAPVVDMSVS